MKISELTSMSRKVNITAKVIEKKEPREVTTRFGKTIVTEAVVEDESGEIALVLWGEDGNKVNEGDEIKVENGYVTEWNGLLQLNIGKYGKLSVL
jgi:ssDNA-binding replication factor A large subunit